MQYIFFLITFLKLTVNKTPALYSFNLFPMESTYTIFFFQLLIKLTCYSQYIIKVMLKIN